MCSLQRNICKTTDRNRRDYSGIYELTRGDQRGRRRRRALDWKTLLLHHLLNPCLLFLSSLDISSSLSLFHPPPLLSLLTDIQARYKKTVVSSPPLLPPSFCLSEVNFPLLFSLFSPEKKKSRCENTNEHRSCIKPNMIGGETKQPRLAGANMRVCVYF